VFFRAEDGIRDFHVTGVQTCALPIYAHPFVMMYNTDICDRAGLLDSDGQIVEITSPEDFLAAGRELAAASDGGHGLSYGYLGDRSEERRVGRAPGCRGWADHHENRAA